MHDDSTRGRLLDIFGARATLHVYFWVVLLVGFSIVINTEQTPPLFTMAYGMTMIGLAILPVYLHLFFFEKLFSGKRYVQYGLIVVAIITIFGLIGYSVLSRAFGDSNGPFTHMFNTAFLLVITTALKLIKSNIRQRLHYQEIKAKHLQAELDLLKSQIHPHFLFNTLNNLFGMARRQEPATADGIAQLSHLMRYQVYESRADRVEVTQEVEQINRFIELQKLRFAAEDEISIEFQVTGTVELKTIPPMLLIPLVENAFKHGISLERASHIRIELHCSEDTIVFSVCNSNHAVIPHSDPQQADQTGIGLRNVERRLELLFPGTHEFQIEQTADEFRIELVLTGEQTG